MAATGTGTGGAIIFALLPILIGQIAERFALNDAQIGLTSSAYFTVYALISLSAPVWIRRVNWRYAALSGYALQILGLFLLQQSSSHTAVIAAMLIAGAGSAVLLPISLALVGDMLRKERAYGITIALGQLVPTILLLGISAAWFGSYGLDNSTALLIGNVVVCLLCSWQLPAQGERTTAERQTAGTNSWGAYAGLIGIAVSFGGFAAMWVFVERVAADNELGTNFTARWIGIGLFMTALGGLFAAVLSDRYGRTLPLVVPIALAIFSTFLLAGEVTRSSYALALVIFPFCYYLSLSYACSVVADADFTGRLASLMSFAFACGALTGPAIFGSLRELAPGTEAPLVACLLGIGVALVVVAQRSTDHLKLTTIRQPEVLSNG